MQDGHQDIRLVPSVISGDPNDRRSIVTAAEGRYGLCTTSGDYVAPIYDEMEPDDDDNVHVRLGDTWGYISGDGEFLPEPLSDEDQDKWCYNFRPDFD